MTQPNSDFLPGNIDPLCSFAHGHALHESYIVINNDIAEEMNDAELGQFLEDILFLILIKLGIKGFLFDLVGPPLDLVDSLPKLLLLEFKLKYFVLESIGILLNLIQIASDFLLVLLQLSNLLF